MQNRGGYSLIHKKVDNIENAISITLKYLKHGKFSKRKIKALYS